ncbi:hypothetical protein LCM02_08300 [Lutimonas saemankumensis]|uniref:hypothetical protein n=1 Tax=Lutimonas saemankumensis TaxID=483016 RepID=UPI001CD2C13F|nr:hypothetical protein [Lutimonas saemankumensis]MCA0932449.1 hypothetical protein [Lutimonas saemankumensis]
MKKLLLLAFVLLVSSVQAQAQWTKTDFENIFKEYDYKRSQYFEEYHFNFKGDVPEDYKYNWWKSNKRPELRDDSLLIYIEDTQIRILYEDIIDLEYFVSDFQRIKGEVFNRGLWQLNLIIKVQKRNL